MVSLTSQARLLAAQAFNRRVIASRIAAGKGRTSASDIGRLTGVRPRVVRGRVVGLTNIKSATRLRTDRLLKAEITRQRQLAARKSDLDRFLANEQRLLSGSLSLSQIRSDIARRKRKGLSKTPAQRTALARAEGRVSTTRLARRVIRKRARGVTVTTPSRTRAIQRAEAERAFGFGSAEFIDPLGTFGGRSRAEVVARGGTFGRRVGGEAISTQLAGIRAQRKRATSERISFAQSLLGDPFSGAPSADLLGVVAGRGRRAPRSLAQRQREGVGFFVEERAPITERAVDRTRRQRRVVARKREDVGKAATARRKLERQRAGVTGIFVLGSQVFGEGSGFGRVAQARGITKKGVDPRERERLARERQLQTDLLRASGFERPALVPATGIRGTVTETFSPRLPVPRAPTQVSLQETLGFADVLGTTRKVKGKKRATRTRPSAFPPSIDLGSLFSGVRSGEILGVTGTVREARGGDFGFGGAFEFFGSELGREAGREGVEFLGEPFRAEGGIFGSFGRAGEALVGGDFGFDVDTSFDPEKAAQRTAEIFF